MIVLCFALILVTIIPATYATQTVNHAKSHMIFIVKCAVKGICFYPCQITVPIGETVTWVNRDTVNHMLISGNAQSGPDGWFTSPVIFPHGTYSHVFDRKFPYTYFDNYNTYAQGVVIVDSSIHSNFVKLQQSYFSDWWCNQ
jgi:plastocyanin